MKRIELTQGKFALVDDEWVPILTQFKWHLGNSKSRHHYAFTNIRDCEGKSVRRAMHRMIMSAPRGLLVDHINGDGLDNRLVNLRLCTHQLNSINRRARANKFSRYKGVCFSRSAHCRYEARITYGGKQHRLGSYFKEEDAARAYDVAAKSLFGEFARLNFPEKRGA